MITFLAFCSSCEPHNGGVDRALRLLSIFAGRNKLRKTQPALRSNDLLAAVERKIKDFNDALKDYVQGIQQRALNRIETLSAVEHIATHRIKSFKYRSRLLVTIVTSQASAKICVFVGLRVTCDHVEFQIERAIANLDPQRCKSCLGIGVIVELFKQSIRTQKLDNVFLRSLGVRKSISIVNSYATPVRQLESSFCVKVIEDYVQGEESIKGML